MGNKRWVLLCSLVLLGSTSIDWQRSVRSQPSAQDRASRMLAQNHSSRTQKRPAKPPARKAKQSRSWLQRFVSIFKPMKKPPLGSRGPLCPITPGLLGETDIIWSDRPVFVWKGIAKDLTLLNYDTGEVLWQHTLSSVERQVIYDGPTLQPGHVYIWRLTQDGKQQEQTFEVMSSNQRRQIVPPLENMANLAENFEESDEMQRTLQRAGFFSEHGLWSDAFAELYRVSSYELSWQTALDQLSTNLCDATKNLDEVLLETVSMP